MRNLADESGHEEQWRRGERRTVAFVDILGFSNEVMKLDSDRAAFPTVVGALLGGFSVAEPVAGGPDNLFSQEGGDEPSEDLQFVFFSDCAVVSARIVPGAPDDVIEVVLGYARKLLMHGFFLRGGIARGLVAHRDGLVVGPAFLQAYHLELKAAVYPRIVVADEIAQDLLALADLPNPTVTIRRSEDGLFFVDVLTTLGLRDGGGDLLRKARQLIVDRLKPDDKAGMDIVAKWRWLAAQYNRAVESVKNERGDLIPPIEHSEVARLPDSM